MNVLDGLNQFAQLAPAMQAECLRQALSAALFSMIALAASIGFGLVAGRVLHSLEEKSEDIDFE